MRRWPDGGENANGATELVAMVGGCSLNSFLGERYRLVRLFGVYMLKRSPRLMVLKLVPSFAAVASIIALNKKQVQEKDWDPRMA